MGYSEINKTSVREDQKLPSFDFIWRNFAPPRVKFFAWLLIQDRIQCKTNLEKKGLLSNATCDLCKIQDEDANHIVSGCSFARSFWRRIGWQPREVQRLWETRTPHRAPREASCPYLPPPMLLGVVEAPSRCGLQGDGAKRRETNCHLQEHHGPMGMSDAEKLAHLI